MTSKAQVQNEDVARGLATLDEIDARFAKAV